MALVALVDVGAFDLAAGEGLGFRDHLPQGMAVVGVSGQRLGVEDELAALAALVGGGQRDLDAELVRGSGLSLADAFDLRGMPGIELPAALTLLLCADSARPW